MEKQKMYLVPEVWLKSLLENVSEYEEANKEWTYGGGMKNAKVHFEATKLAGYAKSANSILKFNESVEK